MVDPAASTFQIGKRAIKTIRVSPDTKLRNGAGGPAKFADIVMGAEVTGSYRMGGDGLLQAISMRVGAKAPRAGVAAIPAAPSPAPKTSGSAAAH